MLIEQNNNDKEPAAWLHWANLHEEAILAIILITGSNELLCGVQAAGAIHTDFERGFICAEVMHYDELKELGTEAAVRAAGKYRQEVRACLNSPC